MLFDEAWYLCTYPDVRAAVVSGGLESGYYHYITCGKNEGRIPCPPVSAQGDSTKSGNIVFETELTIRLLASAAVIYAFERHRISLGERPPNFAPFIELDKSAELEPYCAFMNGSNIFSRGFSTYQYTSADFIAGRYCSIATGVSTLGERHPLEHVTTSSLAYDREKPLFSWIRKDLLEGLQSQIFPAIPLAEGPPILEHDVWVGQHAQLARGITLHTMRSRCRGSGYERRACICNRRWQSRTCYQVSFF
jgi:hypothetical protein